MKEITIKPQFLIGDIVYFVTDPMQLPHIVTALKVEEKQIKYCVSHAYQEEIEVSYFEISDTKNYIFTID